MTKNILFFSAEAGGAEVLTPVVRLLRNSPLYEICVLSYGHGRKRFLANGIECVETGKIVKGDRDALERYHPDLIITSAAGIPRFDMSDKYLWETARETGIKTIAFLDQWQNYAMRFSGVEEGERLAYLPDLINCIDHFGLEEMKSEGFPEDMLVPLGHPYLFERQGCYASANAVKARNKCREGPSHSNRHPRYCSCPRRLGSILEQRGDMISTMPLACSSKAWQELPERADSS